MPTTFSKAHSAEPYVEDMLGLYHRELRDAGVTFDTLFARAERNEDGDFEPGAIKHGGYPCAAKIRIVSLKDRAKGVADVELLIDEDEWEVLSEEQRNALVDHELEHIELQLEETEDGGEAVVKRDDLGRPKLKIRLHDRSFGWFDVCAERHGENSVESIQLRKFQDDEQYSRYLAEV